MKLLLIALVSLSAFAQDSMPYKIKEKGFAAICDNSKLELKNLPPVRDQGRFGLCYAHSSILLLEYLRCGKTPNPTDCYNNKGSVLHLSRFHNTVSENKIKIGGDPRSVLTRFREQKKLATESCAEYDDWKKLDQLYKKERAELKVPREYKDEVDFFYYISMRMKQNTATQNDLNCWANDLQKAGVNQNLQDIMSILSRGKDFTWQELRYQLLVPKSCMGSMIQYPDYEIHSYPKYKEEKTFKGFRDFVYNALSQGLPVEASFKSSADGYHSATIVGQRHVCDSSRCEYQFRIQNSYGRSWQDNFDDGWVNAEHLSNMMADQSMGVTTIIPRGSKINTKLTAPYYESSPINAKSSYSSQEKCWKVAPGSQQYVGDRPRLPPTRPAAGPSYTGQKGFWKCIKDGKTSFTDFAIAGADCKNMK